MCLPAPDNGVVARFFLHVHLRSDVITDDDFAILVSLASKWAQEQEQRILRDGVPLSPAQLSDARKIGLAHPDRVRLLKVPAIPIPENPILQSAADATQLISPATNGLTVRYGIFIRADGWDDRDLIRHELVHTLQYERLGGIPEFLERYLYECITIGYPAAPMEQEAIETAARLSS